MKDVGLYLFMAAGPLQEIMREEPRESGSYCLVMRLGGVMVKARGA